MAQKRGGGGGGTILPEQMDLMFTEFSVMADGEKSKNLFVFLKEHAAAGKNDMEK